MTEDRARLSRASSSVMSSSCPKPHDGASWASALCTSTRVSPVLIGSGYGVAGGMPGSNAPSTSRPHTFSNGTLPTRSSMSTPRYRSAPPSLSGSAISVANATTPSSPDCTSAVAIPTLLFSPKKVAEGRVLAHGKPSLHPEPVVVGPGAEKGVRAAAAQADGERRALAGLDVGSLRLEVVRAADHEVVRVLAEVVDVELHRAALD